MKRPLSRRAFIATAAASLAAPAFARTHSMSAVPGSPLPGGAEDDASQPAWKDAGVIDLAHSPYAKLKTVPVRAVEIREGFWSRRRVTNVEASIPSMHDELVQHGRMDNFLRLEGKASVPQKGPVYSDSDIYKWTEAVGFALQSGDQPALRTMTDAMIRDVVATQEPSGYLNTYYVDDRKPLRMTYQVQTTGHELYCIGHLLHALKA